MRLLHLFSRSFLFAFALFAFLKCGTENQDKEVNNTKQPKTKEYKIIMPQISILTISDEQRDRGVQKIKKRYYNAVHSSNDTLTSFWSKEGIQTSSATYQYDKDLALKKIIFNSREENLTREFCFDNDSLYFMFEKAIFEGSATKKDDRKNIEQRYYIENNSLIQFLYKEIAFNKKQKIEEPNLYKKLDTKHFANIYNQAYQLLAIGAKAIAQKGYTKKMTAENMFPALCLVYKGYLVPNIQFDYKLKGAPYKPSNGLAICDIEEESIPQDLKNQIGKSFMLNSNEGFPLEAKIQSYHVLVDYTPHFGTIQGWEENNIPADKLAKEIFNEGQGTTMIVAKLKTENTVDYEYFWARSTALPKLELGNMANAKFLEIAHNKVHTSAEYNNIVKEYEVYIKTIPGEELPTTWQDYASYEWEEWGSDKINIAFFSAYSGENCGGESYHAAISNLFVCSKQNDIKEKDVFMFENLLGIPKAIIEKDGNGLPLFIFTDYLTYYKIAEYRDGQMHIIQEISIPYFDCPC